jgi:type I restriction enzyme S subunit
MEQKNIPKLRFPNLDGDWREFRLSDFLIRYSETNRDEEFGLDDILSLSSHHGVVSRKQLLEDTYSNVNHLNYKKTRLNDFVYGKSISSSYPFGLFKVNDFKDGLLSTLYFTFKVKDFVHPKFLDCYFSQLTRTNNFLRKFVLVGDRYITADADYLLSGKIYLPAQKEYQQKIATFFTAIDQKISQLKKKHQLLEQYKKGVMQKIFSQQIRFKDDDGKEFPKWEKKRLGELTYKVGKKNKDKKVLPIYSINNKEGFLPQSDQFEGVDSNNRGYDTSLYKIINKNTFAYNPARINVGSIGFSGKLENIIISSLYVCFKTKDGLEDKYLLHFLNTYEFSKAVLFNVEGGVRDYLFYDNFSNIKIPLPSNKEQTKIANFLSALDNKIKHTQKQIEQAEQWKKGLMQKMFV